MAKVSVIIPSLDGYRNGSVPRLIEVLKRQTFQDFEVHLIKGVSPNGKARNTGAKIAKGEILIFIDDDVILGCDNLIEKLIEPFFQDSSIGLVGSSFTIPEDSNRFQKYFARQLPRAQFMPTQDMIETDMVTHACMAIPARLFWQIGAENEKLVRGTDPDLRYRVRAAGFKVVGRKGVLVYHPVAENLLQLIKQAFFAGCGSAVTFKINPMIIYDVAGKPDFKQSYVTNKSLPYRIVRVILRPMQDLITFKFLLFIVHIFNTIGYIFGFLFKKI